MSYDLSVCSVDGSSEAFTANIGNVSDLMRAAFLSREGYEVLDGKRAGDCAVPLFHALCRLVGSERLLFPVPIGEEAETDYRFLRLTQILFQMWHACKENPHYQVSISF